MDDPPVVHPRLGPVRARPRTWWAKAWARAVEEAAYGEDDLRAARALSRAGRVGGIAVRRGGFVAAVEDPTAADGPYPVTGTLPVLDEVARQALAETVAAETGRIAALLAGELPHDVVEHAEEAGVELLPYGGELACTCTCAAWTDPCPHAVAVLDQLTVLVDRDPLVLLHLRGMPREELLARVHAATPATGARDPRDQDVDAEQVDLDVAAEAAAAARLLLRQAGGT